MATIDQRGLVDDGSDDLTVLGSMNVKGSFAQSVLAQQQPKWFIDPIGGNNQLDGSTPATAIKTYTEYTRRTGYGAATRLVTGPVDVWISSSLGPNEVLNVCGFLQSGSYLHVHGVPSTVYTGSIQAFTATNQSLNQAIELVDTNSSLNFAQYIGMQVHITSSSVGAAGQRGWIIKAISSGRARMDWLTIPDASNIYDFDEFTPAVGDKYEIVNLPSVQYVVTDIVGPTSFDTTVAPCYIELVDFGTTSAPNLNTNQGNGMQVYYSRIGQGGLNLEQNSALVGCLSNGGIISNSTISIVSACGILNGALFIVGSHLECEGVVLQGSTIVIDQGGSLGIHNLGRGLGVFDTDSAITFGFGHSCQINMEGPLWGKGNTTFLLALTNGSSVSVSTSYASLFPVTGSGAPWNDFTINAKTALPAVSASNPYVYTADRQLTFANLVATLAHNGFQGSVFDPRSPMTGIFGPG